MKLLARLSIALVFTAPITVHAVDYSVAATAQGINVYSFTTKGMKSAGPFVPSTPLYGADGVQSPAEPLFLAINPARTFVYALYQVDYANPVLVGYKINYDATLTEQFHLASGLEGGGNHLSTVLSMTAFNNYVVVTYHPMQSSVAELAQIYSQAGKQIVEVSETSPPNPVTSNVVAVQVDPNGYEYFACFMDSNQGGSAQPYVNEYALTKPTAVVYTTTDPNIVNSVCYPK